MFEDFYQLTQNPFQINTDPRFLWLGEKHKEALAILQYGVLGNKSFLLLTGDVGTGKTTLINALLKGQGDDTLIATIQDPDLSTIDLYNFIAYSFGIRDRFATKGEFLVGFRKFLEKTYYNGKKVLLIVDEAQRTKQGTLEDIRGLSNIEVDGNKLINIFFVGQNEFNDILLQDENKAIRQRITISYNIKPLTCDEVEKYIHFRLFKAGAKARIFKKNAVDEIFKFTKGYPRLINILCDRCLLTGFVLGKKLIDRKTVRECCEEIKISMPSDTINHNIGCEKSPSEKCQLTTPFFLSKRSFLVCFLVILLGSVWFYSGEVKKMFPSQSSREIPIQGEATPALAHPVSVTEVPAGKQVASLSILNDITRIVLDAVGVKENQEVEVMLQPSSDGGEERRSSGGSDKSNVSKTSISSASNYERKMQIFFQPDSISPAPEYLEELKVFSDWFKELDRGLIVIRGYTDRSGTARYNKKLAKFRADIVKTFLEGTGVAKEKITTSGVISVASSSENRSFPQNTETARRVEIEIVIPSPSD